MSLFLLPFLPPNAHTFTHEYFFCFPSKGATIKKDEQTGAIVVARIMRGGAADRSGKD